ncbi:HTH cro/C1-type domain-containing protein [Paenibacillus alkaliterrae]
MHGIRKPRTRLGKWLDNKGIKQEWLIKKSGLGRNTITWACGEEDYMPSGKTMQRIVYALREIDGSVKGEDFWPI